MKRFSFITLFITISMLLHGCSYNNHNINNSENTPNEPPQTVGDLSYDKRSAYGFRVYIEEGGELVPFLVLTSTYNDNLCLLLREHLLDECVGYNDTGWYGSYYAESKIDAYLQEEYYPLLSEAVRNMIKPAQIDITTKNAIDTHAKETEKIVRKVFLLSANELNEASVKTALYEGEPLEYFKKVDNRKATFSSLEAGSWLLRTAALRDGNTIVGVADDGSVGIGGVNDITGEAASGVRPAFCISPDVEITSCDIDGQSAFSISSDLQI